MKIQFLQQATLPTVIGKKVGIQNSWLDALRIFAAFSVVLVHISAPVTYSYGHLPEGTWVYSHTLESIFRSGLAIFLLLSGALLIPKTIQPIAFLKRRLLRILSPFIFWSLVYAYLNELLFTLPILELLKRIYDGLESHLWFVKVILILYLVLSVVGKAFTQSSKRQLISIWLVGQGILWLSYLTDELLWVSEGRVYLSSFLYMLLGYLLPQIQLSKSIKLGVGATMTFAGILGTFVLGYQQTTNTHQIQDFYYSILSPTIILKSVGIFLLFSALEFRNKKVIRPLHLISQTTFGIYLCHLIFRDSVLHQIGITHHFINPYLGIIVTAISCFILSAVFIFFLTRFKVGKYLA